MDRLRDSIFNKYFFGSIFRSSASIFLESSGIGPRCTQSASQLNCICASQQFGRIHYRSSTRCSCSRVWQEAQNWWSSVICIHGISCRWNLRQLDWWLFLTEIASQNHFFHIFILTVSTTSNFFLNKGGVFRHSTTFSSKSC